MTHPLPEDKNSPWSAIHLDCMQKQVFALLFEPQTNEHRIIGGASVHGESVQDEFEGCPINLIVSGIYN